MPRLDQRDPRTVALTDKAFGVGEQGGPGQGPSYTLALSRIRKLYSENQFELALIDVNNLLQFHPNSVYLTTKGTLYFKLQNLPLARIAWDKALRISPRDRKLAKAIESLDRKQEKAVLPATMPLENQSQSGMFAPSTFSRPANNAAPVLNSKFCFSKSNEKFKLN